MAVSHTTELHSLYDGVRKHLGLASHESFLQRALGLTNFILEPVDTTPVTNKPQYQLALYAFDLVKKSYYFDYY